MKTLTRAALVSSAVFSLACGPVGSSPGDAGGGTAPDSGGAAPDASGSPDSGAASDGGPSPDGGAVDGGPLVTVQGGVLGGIVDGMTYSFRGIPFAAPPVGPLRWAPPAPAASWSGVRDASQFGAVCVQPESDAGIVGDEDCLTLNVWCPGPSTAGARPVMFFTHGGGLSTGAGSDPLYEAADLAQHTGAVVVTINYRLGGLGFLAHPALSAESSPPTSGNEGMLDQIAALRWVHENIAAFGGDPAQVTIFGESAGATSTAVQVLSPLARGLFARAIIESSGILPSYPTLSEAETAGQGIASTLGCGTASDVMGCLRALPAATVIAQTVTTDWQFRDLLVTSLPYRFLPVVDGQLLLDQPYATFADGGQNQVPILIGNNAQEAGYFVKVGMIPEVKTDAGYVIEMDALLGSNASAVMVQYPVASYPSVFSAYLTALSDGAFICRSRKVARLILGAQSQPVRRYLFAQTLRGPDAVFGSMHTLELFFLFRTLPIYGYPMDTQETAVADTLQEYWGNFASTGDPNDATAVAWPPNDAANDSLLEIVNENGVTTQPLQGYHEALCDFWDGLGLY